MSKHVLLDGTYVGAYVKEAVRAESRQVFINEMAIALRKASETEYWLQLLQEAGYLDQKALESINSDCIELIKLLTSIVKTSKSAD